MDQVLQALYAVLALIITALGGLAVSKINSFTDAQIDKIKDDKVRDRVRLARDAVMDAVHHVSQTLAPELKAAAADGKITVEEREQLRQLALSKTKESFSKQFWLDLKDDLELDEIDSWILDRVEAEVFRMKPITEMVRHSVESLKAAHDAGKAEAEAEDSDRG